MKTFEKITRAGTMFIIISGLVIINYSCSSSIASDTSQRTVKNAIPVAVQVVTTEDFALPVHVSGIISASKESRLSFKTGGIIKRIFVDEGDKVTKGQKIAQLDLKEINQQVYQAKVALDKAHRDYKRIDNLYRDTVSTLEQLQNTKSALEIAEANLNIAEYNLKFSTIYAPDNGIILKKFMEENEIAGVGTPVFYFASSEESWKMKVGITDKSIVKIKSGDLAEIVTDAYPEIKLRATVSNIASAPDLNTGLYEIELSIENNRLGMKPGFFARGDILPSEKIRCYKVPVDAVTEGLGRNINFFIYDEQKQKAVEAIAEVIYLEDNYAFVRDKNLPEKFKVITGSQKEINHMDDVKVNETLVVNQETVNRQ